MARQIIQVHAEEVGFRVVEVSPGNTFVAECTEDGCGFQTAKSTSTGRVLVRPIQAHRDAKHGES